MLMNFELKKRILLQKENIPKNVLWVHVASVGEFNTFLPILKELKKKHKILLTFFSPRAKEFLENKNKFYDFLYPLPLDVPTIIRNFERSIKPKALIIVEREFWPSLIMFTNAKKILVNTYAKNTFFERILSKRFDLIITRSEKDEEVFRSYGAKKVVSCGNLKFICQNENKNLRLSTKNKIIVAGSTHKGEEEIILNAFKKVKQEIKDTVLVLVPRHVERASEVMNTVKSFSFRCSFFTDFRKDSVVDVIVVNKLGVLKDLYAIGEVAIVGGTFVRLGGHNLLEPACFNIPVIYGPYTFKVRDLKEFLEKNKIGYEVKNWESLRDTLLKILKDKHKPVVNIKEYSERIKRCYLREIEEILRT